MLLFLLFVCFFSFFLTTANHLKPITFNNIDAIYQGDTQDFVLLFKEGDNSDFTLRDAASLGKHLMYRPVSTLLFKSLKLDFGHFI